MAINGTYGFNYSGIAGMGFGVMSVVDGVASGSDFAGGRYSGTAAELADGSMRFDLTVVVPAGSWQVMGTAAQDVTTTRTYSVTLDPEQQGGVPREIYAAPGMMWLTVQAVPDEWAPYSQGFTILPGG